MIATTFSVQTFYAVVFGDLAVALVGMMIWSVVELWIIGRSLDEERDLPDKPKGDV